ncbi:CP4-6 prophage protein [Escherichia coli]|nr:CP4-6 prophage protein [Escherichia coli]
MSLSRLPFFNKDAYYHLGNYDRSDTLRGLITGAWYSALGLELEDHQGLVHFPANGRYILDINDPDFPEQYQRLGNDSNLLIVFYVQIMPDDFVMQLHRF